MQIVLVCFSERCCRTLPRLQQSYTVLTAKQLPTFRSVVILLSPGSKSLRLLYVFKLFLLTWWYFHHIFVSAIIFIFILLLMLMACVKIITTSTRHLNATLQLTVRASACRVFNFSKQYGATEMMKEQRNDKGDGCLLLSKTNNMQRYTIFFITVNALHASAVSPPIIRSSKTVRATSGICQDCLLLPLAWVSWNNSTTLTVAASKPGTNRCCVYSS